MGVLGLREEEKRVAGGASGQREEEKRVAGGSGLGLGVLFRPWRRDRGEIAGGGGSGALRRLLLGRVAAEAIVLGEVRQHLA